MIFEGITFLTAAIILLTVVAILVVAHFLNEKYTRMVVPSTLFWTTAVRATRQSIISGKFRHLKTLLLLTFFGALLIMTLLKPEFSGDSREYIFIIDCRYGMSTKSDDLGNSRLDVARKICTEMINEISSSSLVALITVGDSVSVLANADDSRIAVLEGLKKLQQTSSVSCESMVYAVNLADKLVGSNLNCQVQIFSDRNLSDLLSGTTNGKIIKQFDPSGNSQDSESCAFIPEYKHKVFLSDQCPKSLELFFDVSEYWEITNIRPKADLIVSTDVDEQISGIPGIVIHEDSTKPTRQGKILLSGYMANICKGSPTIHTDLFAGTGGVISAQDNALRPLLVTDNGAILAGMSDSHRIELAEALFAQDATFWKQPQFLKIMSVFSLLAIGEYDTRRDHDISDEVVEYKLSGNRVTAKELIEIADPEWLNLSCYRFILILAIVGLILDFILYSRGAII